MSKSKKPPNKNRAISDSEAELWDKVAKTTTPLEKGKNRVTGHAAYEAEEETPPRQEADPEPPMTAEDFAPEDFKPENFELSASEKNTPVSQTQFNRKKIRKLAKGHEGIDARIDLHGLYQDPAYNALRSFLISAQAKGHRNVLVITGKGIKRDEEESTHWLDDDKSRNRGVLKRMLPVWLNEPELRSLVISYSEAHIRHGGSGAYYIRIRKP